MRRVAVVALAVAAATAVVAVSAVPAVGAEPSPVADTPIAVSYRPPLDGPVTDAFRPPDTPYGGGNRGIDYATEPGTAVTAAAAGQVVFAGRVGAGLHVVILHADGIRTSYSFLASVAVRRGQRVEAGQPLAVAASTLHFGARAGDAYLDPLVLLGHAGGEPVVHLVPEAERVMGSMASERDGLRRLLGALPGTVVRVGKTAVGWARDGAVSLGAGGMASVEPARDLLVAVVPLREPPWLRLATGLERWWDSRSQCTPAGVSPAPVTRRRRAVLVAGLGSTSGPSGIDGVDTAALGYHPDDVMRFSYRAGTTREAPYRAVDTQVDIAESGRRLRVLLERMLSAEPGVPIDVIAHSQGGLVSRSALGPRAPPGVENLITLATPHRGADLATALDLTGRTSKGALVQDAASYLRLSGIDPRSVSVHQLSELSGFIRQLNARPLPQGVRVTSIAARADVVVPSPRARLPGATNVVVTVKGLHEHPLVAASPSATREMALAIAGMAPTCEALADAALDLVAGEAIGAVEDTAVLALWAVAR